MGYQSSCKTRRRPQLQRLLSGKRNFQRTCQQSLSVFVSVGYEDGAIFEDLNKVKLQTQEGISDLPELLETFAGTAAVDHSGVVTRQLAESDLPDYHFISLFQPSTLWLLNYFQVLCLLLAERIRPTSLDELEGQQHLAGKGSILRTSIEYGRIHSMILWGPPGTGKTTIANIIAHTLNVPFFTLSAISSGVKDVREVIEEAKSKPGSILFIDEIHRFNKGQQDALLGAVEKGIITLIGATTENPSLKYNSALLSRCQVYILKP